MVEQIRARIAQLPEDSTVIHGGCRGPDQQAAAAARSCRLAVIEEAADWRTFGISAGPLRNERMLLHGPDLVIAFWDGRSRGTSDMIRRARHAGIPVEIVQAP
jgi:hypothetical protein